MCQDILNLIGSYLLIDRNSYTLVTAERFFVISLPNWSPKGEAQARISYNSQDTNAA